MSSSFVVFYIQCARVELYEGLMNPILNQVKCWLRDNQIDYKEIKVERNFAANLYQIGISGCTHQFDTNILKNKILLESGLFRYHKDN
jgi:hypothetical protein